MKSMRKHSMVALGFLVFMLMLAGCDSTNSDPVPEGPAPEPITVEAFTVETSLFQPAGSKQDGAASNFTAAAERVWPLSASLDTNLTIAVTLTAAALQITPTFERVREVATGRELDLWVWSSEVEVKGQAVTFSLSAEPDLAGFNWHMHMTTSGPLLGRFYDQFILYIAQTSLDGKSGTWELYYPINPRTGAQGNLVLKADFQILGDGQKEIIYSILPHPWNEDLYGPPPEGFEQYEGDSVLYAAEGDARHFLWQQAEGFEHDIAWDAATHEGSITATNYNQGQQGCWDADLEDIACSN